MRRISLFALLLALTLPIAVYGQETTPEPTPQATTVPEYRTLLPVGAVQAYAGITPPDGWLAADGSCLAREAFARLYEAIGTVYGDCGGNPALFALPDLRGRAAIGAGTGDGLTTRVQGTELGEENHQITVAEMPEHNHNLEVSNSTTGGTANFTYFTSPRVVQATKPSTAAGGSQPHNNMPPSTVLTYIIWTGTEQLELGVPGTPGETPTPEGTPEPTLTPTPNLYAVWTLQPESTDEPGQAAAIVFEMSAGGMVNSLLLFAIFVSILVIVVLILLRKQVVK